MTPTPEQTTAILKKLAGTWQFMGSFEHHHHRLTVGEDGKCVATHIGQAPYEYWLNVVDCDGDKVKLRKERRDEQGRVTHMLAEEVITLQDDGSVLGTNAIGHKANYTRRQ